MAPRTAPSVIVIVEDPFIRRFVRTVLGHSGEDVQEKNAEDAFKLAEEGQGKVKLLITNTPEAFKTFNESVPILYLAAMPDMKLASRFRNIRVLQKPFSSQELLTAVNEVTNLT